MPPAHGGSLSRIDCELVSRTGHSISCEPPCTFVLPHDVVFEDGLSEEEAIATALANNSTFQATLTQLGMAEGDYVQAGLLTNPNFSTFLPLSAKQWEWKLFVPIEAFILRPERLAATGSQYETVANQLVQNGLNLVRDVRVAHTELALAIAQRELAADAVGIRRGIAEISEKRLNRGDIGELETITTRVDALNAVALEGLLDQRIVVARSRLALLMGMPPENYPFSAELTRPPAAAAPEVETLIAQALANRPDAHAAQWSVDSAAHRAELARRQFLRFDFVADANAKGFKGFEAGPGVRFDIPIFNRNQGGVMRADAELAQAMHLRGATHEQIVQEVRASAAEWKQALDQLAILESRVVPALSEAQELAEKGYAAGGADYLLVLQTTSQYLDARTRLLDQLAALRRARAELERSLGAKLPPGLEEIPLPEAEFPLPEIEAPFPDEEFE